jgi:hypothetical protein
MEGNGMDKEEKKQRRDELAAASPTAGEPAVDER